MLLEEWRFNLSVSSSVPEIDNFAALIEYDWVKKYDPEKIIAWKDESRTEQLPIDTSRIKDGVIWVKMDLRHKSKCFLEYSKENKNITKPSAKDVWSHFSECYLN